MRQSIVSNGLFKRVKIGSIEANRRKIEILVGPPFPAVKLLHPSVQVRMLAPVEQLGAVAGFAEVHFRNMVTGGEGIHIEAHDLLVAGSTGAGLRLLFVAEDREA